MDEENSTSSPSRRPTMLTTWRIGGGCTALRHDEPSTGLFCVITLGDDAAAPTEQEAEVEELDLGVYDEDLWSNGETFGLVTLKGREGLNQWYEENVGYRPDDEITGPLKILDLVDLAAGMMCHHAFDRLAGRS